MDPETPRESQTGSAPAAPAPVQCSLADTLTQLLDPGQALTRLDQIARKLDQLIAAVEHTQHPHILDETLHLTTKADLPIHLHGRAHSKVWSAAQITVKVTGQFDDTQLQLAVGWTQLDLPEGTRLRLVDANPAAIADVLYRVYDWD